MVSAEASACVRPVDDASSRLAIYPGGALLLGEPAVCRVSAIESDRVRWMREFASCGGLVELAVANDSTAYVRTGDQLFAIDFDGRERWRTSFDAQVPRAIATPTAMLDSRAVVATSPHSISAYQLDGKPAWRFSTPTNETIMAAPSGMRTEGVGVATSHAAYVLGPAGELRWREAAAFAKSAP